MLCCTVIFSLFRLHRHHPWRHHRRRRLFPPPFFSLLLFSFLFSLSFPTFIPLLFDLGSSIGHCTSISFSRRCCLQHQFQHTWHRRCRAPSAPSRTSSRQAEHLQLQFRFLPLQLLRILCLFLLLLLLYQLPTTALIVAFGLMTPRAALSARAVRPQAGALSRRAAVKAAGGGGAKRRSA